MRSSALFLPKNLPPDLSPWNYVFQHNETHVALPLDYGGILNHHDSPNTKVVFAGKSSMHFQVRGSTCTAVTVLYIQYTDMHVHIDWLHA